MTNTISFPYSDIPGFPLPSVIGHAGELVFGDLSGVPAVCLRGRFHSYEGYDMQTVVLPVRVLRCLGVKFLVVTNAAGGLNRGYNIGDVVCVMDHFALPMLAGRAGNPLVGPNDDELGPRFPPTSNIYDEELQSMVIQSAKDMGFGDFVRSNGTYCFVSGPQYESRAECKFLLAVGGDCVGMSTIPEVVAAHHCGMKVLCLSLITNKVVMDGSEGPAASHQEVLDSVRTRSVQIQGLVKEIVRNSKVLIEGLPELKPITLPTKGGKGSVCSTCGLPHSYVIGALTVTALGAAAAVLLGKKK